MNIKKTLTLTSLIGVGASILMLICAIFGLKVFEWPLLSILLTFATIAMASAFAINAFNLMPKNKIISYIALSLLGVITILWLVVFFSDFKVSQMFTNIVGVISIATVLFNIIVSNNLKLEKRLLGLQLATYILFTIITILLSLLIFGVQIFDIKGMLEIFLVVCLVAIGLLISLKILSKKVVTETDYKTNEEYIKIKKSEYDALVSRINELEKQLEQNQ